MYKGNLRGFPTEVVNWMLEQQYKQGNPKKVHVFEKDILTSRVNGGFDWYIVNKVMNSGFCNSVLKNRNFDLFFSYFPKKSTYPKVMWVSDVKEYLDSPLKRLKRVVFMEKNNKFLAWGNSETLEKAELTTYTSAWHFAKDIEEEPQLVELTMKDISEGKGVGVDPKLIRIKE